MTLRRARACNVAEGVIGHYVHGAVADGLGKIGVIVALEFDRRWTKLAALGRQIAMHVAAASPLALDAAGLDPATVAAREAVLAEKNAGKPAHVLEKIVEIGPEDLLQGSLPPRSGLVHDSAKTVAQAVKEAEKTVGAPIALTGFVRYALGEGIEKPAEEA